MIVTIWKGENKRYSWSLNQYKHLNGSEIKQKFNAVERGSTNITSLPGIESTCMLASQLNLWKLLYYNGDGEMKLL